MGLMLSAYFSAILSTADSCLIAASGNIRTDILGKILSVSKNSRTNLWTSQIITIMVGVLALMLAYYMENVLQLMLYSYAFMVSGLFVPVVAALFFKSRNSIAAVWSMLLGGVSTIILIVTNIDLPFGLDAIIFGIIISLITFITLSKTANHKK